MSVGVILIIGLDHVIQVMNTGKEAADVTLLFTWAVSSSFLSNPFVRMGVMFEV